MATDPPAESLDSADGLTRTVRILFVGRRTTAATLRELVETLPMPPDLLTLTNQKAALLALRSQPPRLVLLEVDEESARRTRFTALVRQRLREVPIVAVGPAAAQDGFDGVVAKPPSPEALAALVSALMAEAQGETAGDMLRVGPLRLDVAARLLTSPLGRRHLTPKQCALLYYLMRHPNQVMSRAQIMAAVWETDYVGDTRTLDVHIRWLRESIEVDPSGPLYLLTVRGQGYMLKILPS